MFLFCRSVCVCALFSHGNTKKSQGWWRLLWRAVRSKSVFVVFLFSSLFSQNDWLTTDWSPPPSPFPFCTEVTRVGVWRGGGRFIQRFFRTTVHHRSNSLVLLHLSLSPFFFYWTQRMLDYSDHWLHTCFLFCWPSISIGESLLFFLGTIGWPALSLCDWLILVWWRLSQEKWIKQSEQWLLLLHDDQSQSADRYFSLNGLKNENQLIYKLKFFIIFDKNDFFISNI